VVDKSGGSTRDDANVKGEINEIVDLVKAYAKQETVDPLRNVGRYLGFGLAGGFLLALGFILLLISLLRVLQTQTDVFDGNWSFVPYVIVVLVGAVIAGLFASRISKGSVDG
jgi:flagellar biosynthesis protein FliQ